MNFIWNSENKSWVLYEEGTNQKYLLNLTWSNGIAAFLQGGIIEDCKVEVRGTVILQKSLIVPHPTKQIGDYCIKAFPLVEL